MFPENFDKLFDFPDFHHIFGPKAGSSGDKFHLLLLAEKLTEILINMKVYFVEFVTHLGFYLPSSSKDFNN